MLLPREPLFLCCGKDVTVPEDAGGAVVVEAGNAENMHTLSAPFLHLEEDHPTDEGLLHEHLSQGLRVGEGIP